MTPVRGELYVAALEVAFGSPEKVVAVVSTNAINAAGLHAIVVRLTTTIRERSVPTAVEIEPDSENRLDEASFVLCHDVTTVRREALSERAIGRLSTVDLFKVEKALAYAFDLVRSA